MKKKFPRVWRICYSIALVAFTAYIVLDTFVIPRSYSVINAAAGSSAATTLSALSAGAAATTGASKTVTATSYDDGNISITITTYRKYDTNIYVADVTLSDASYLTTAFAKDTYGKNISATTSDIASAHNSILAINGDFYGARTSGYVVRNGVVYRSTSAGSSQQDLVITSDGSFYIVKEGSISAAELVNEGAQQVFSFGPGLIENGEVTVSQNTEVDQAMTSNPRTAIGIIGALHYVFVVADGRTSASTGLSLYQMAVFLQSLGVQTAYNLDGGGSSTMVFEGTVINNPTTSGKQIAERKVSDIVAIG